MQKWVGAAMPRPFPIYKIMSELTSYQPTGTFLMVDADPDITQVGGILLPNQSRIQMNEGTVRKVGTHAKGSEGEVLFVPGDRVCWDENSEYRMDIDGDKFVLVNAERILLKIPTSLASKIATVAKLSEK